MIKDAMEKNGFAFECSTADTEITDAVLAS